jgi:hypothetical protein
MDGTCNTHGEVKIPYKILVKKSKREKVTWEI